MSVLNVIDVASRKDYLLNIGITSRTRATLAAVLVSFLVVWEESSANSVRF